jgi:hypothetical protein
MADNRQMIIDLDKKRMTAMAQKDVSTLNATRTPRRGSTPSRA